MSTEISIELFPAGNGDALLIDTGDALILIDGGYTSTFRDHLKPRLKEFHEAGRRLTKFIITHIDADHISGAIALIKENGAAEAPSIIAIDEIWFNSYRHLQFEDKVEGVFEGDLPDIVIGGGLESVEADETDLLVSQAQGSTLGSQILRFGYPWNETFQRNAVLANDPKSIPIGPDTTITLLGPTKTSLERLGDHWYDYLKNKFAGSINEDEYFDDAFELMMEEMRQVALESMNPLDQERLVSDMQDWVEENAGEWEDEDKSPTNGSSIIFLLESGSRKMLFLGDAIPGEVVDQLQKLLSQGKTYLGIDVLKVAHHGAWSNNSPELMQIIRADYYLFSSSGSRHHHPHFETMAWILKSHGADSSKTLVFNYKQGDRLDSVNDTHMKSVYNYKVIGPEVDEWGNGSDGYVRINLNKEGI